MKLPARIMMRPTLFADGAKGMAIQESRNDEFGVLCCAKRGDRFSRWTEEWFAECLPGQSFATYGELVAAANALP